MRYARTYNLTIVCVTVVDYGDRIPTSEGLQRIIGGARLEEGNQCVLLHLDTALVQSETTSTRSPLLPVA